MSDRVSAFATVDPFAGMTESEPAVLQNLVGGKWVADIKERDYIIDPMNGQRFIDMPDTHDVTPFIEGLKSCPKTGLHNPMKNTERYIALGRVCAKAAAMLAEQDVLDFFTRLTQRKGNVCRWAA